jgi:hypothetical protein
MSRSLYYICPETRTRVWCGQGWDLKDYYLYSSEKEMPFITKFMEVNIARKIILNFEDVFQREYQDWERNWAEYGEPGQNKNYEEPK